MKKFVKTMIALIATMAGLFGGWKLYADHKQKGAENLDDERKHMI